jgi:hypothetical protein
MNQKPLKKRLFYCENDAFAKNAKSFLLLRGF